MTPTAINTLNERLIAYRDGKSDRAERAFLADVCNALDGYTKQTRVLRDLRDAISKAEGK